MCARLSNRVCAWSRCECQIQIFSKELIACKHAWVFRNRRHCLSSYVQKFSTFLESSERARARAASSYLNGWRTQKEKSRAWTTLASQNACRTFEAPLKPLCKLYCFQSSEISGTYATWGDKRAVAGPPSHPPLSPSYTTSMPSSGESRLAPRGEFLSPSGETLY